MEGPDAHADRWRNAVASLRVWQRGGERAVHKPLLLLVLLARAEAGGGDAGRFAYVDLEEPVRELLREFGPPRSSYHAEYPFWHLQSDDLWVVEGADELPIRKAGHSPSRTELVSRDAHGYVPPGLWEAVVADAALRRELVEMLLDAHWPATLHGSLRRAIGLPDAARVRTRTERVRDPAFRSAVLAAYGGRCAACGYDGRLGAVELALEAAHIRWHCYEGPDTPANGLALCSLHHEALDRGAWALTDDRRITLSADLAGSDVVGALFFDLAGRPLHAPRDAAVTPDLAHIRWHRTQVFKAPPRAS